MNGRRRPAVDPIAIVIVLAAIPAFLLWSLWNWAGDKSEAADAAPPTSTTIVPPPTPPPALNTPLGSLRRTAPALARDLNLEAFRSTAQPLLGAVNGSSCVGLSVDGYDAGTANAEAVVLPASTIKLVVAAVALEVLGDTFTFTTRVAGPQPAGGVVTGDVYLVGGGDPVLSSAWYPTSNLERFPVFNATSLDALADALVAAGISRIDGRVVGDGTRYDDELFAPGWASGVAGLEGGPYDALMANDSRVLGEDLRADEPVAAAARELVRLLSDRGVVVATGAADSGQAPAGLTDLAAVQSRPLTDVVQEMLTNSDNNTAELMVKEIGLAGGGAGTREAGLAVIRSTLESWGLEVGGLVLADGSGLSLDNRLTCAVLLAVLQREGFEGPIGQGLAIAGQTGTLIDIFTDSEVAGRLRGKTGTLNNPPFNEDPPAVKGLAGYLPVDGGGAIEFVMILNGPTISDQSEYRPLWDQLVDVLVSYPSAAGPDQLGPR